MLEGTLARSSLERNGEPRERVARRRGDRSAVISRARLYLGVSAGECELTSRRTSVTSSRASRYSRPGRSRSAWQAIAVSSSSESPALYRCLFLLGVRSRGHRACAAGEREPLARRGLQRRGPRRLARRSTTDGLERLQRLFWLVPLPTLDEARSVRTSTRSSRAGCRARATSTSTSTSAGNGRARVKGCARSIRAPAGRHRGAIERCHTRRGLSLGIWVSHQDCRQEPGVGGYEAVDAETFAAWGVDYVKYVGCRRG